MLDISITQSQDAMSNMLPVTVCQAWRLALHSIPIVQVSRSRTCYLAAWGHTTMLPQNPQLHHTSMPYITLVPCCPVCSYCLCLCHITCTPCSCTCQQRQCSRQGWWPRRQRRSHRARKLGTPSCQAAAG